MGLGKNKTYNSGSFDRKITFQQRTTTKDALNNVLDTWSSVKTVWSSVKTGNSNEPFIDDMEIYKDGEVFTIRYFAYLNNPELRIQFEGKNFNIEKIKEIGRRRFLQFVCSSYE